MHHQLPPLPYPMDALEPHISRETMEFHYGKHHKAYVDKLNELIKGTEFQDATLEDMLRRAKGKIYNNAAQTWNHTFFWQCMAQKGGGKPSGALLKAIDASFGSFDEFKKKFSDAAAELFGSGWTWLVKRADGSLALEPESNANTPLGWNDRPLLTLDVWEHAYYVDYRNRRPDFISAFWNVVNWDFAAKNYSS